MKPVCTPERSSAIQNHYKVISLFRSSSNLGQYDIRKPPVINHISIMISFEVSLYQPMSLQWATLSAYSAQRKSGVLRVYIHRMQQKWSHSKTEHLERSGQSTEADRHDHEDFDTAGIRGCVRLGCSCRRHWPTSIDECFWCLEQHFERSPRGNVELLHMIISITLLLFLTIFFL